jgi:hypothetical protein
MKLFFLSLLACGLWAQEPLKTNKNVGANVATNTTVEQLQKENAELKAYIAQIEAFYAKSNQTLNGAIAACIGQPPPRPKMEENKK